jgi:hypothetical protein
MLLSSFPIPFNLLVGPSKIILRFSTQEVTNALLPVSGIYFAYNSLMTTYLVAHEWGKFSKERKALRVSAPKGVQRSSYFLTLPFKYSIPLLAFSMALHFFISTSVFLVRTTFYDISGKLDEEASQSHVGFSSMGIILALLVGTTMVVALVLLAWLRKYPAEMPLVSTRSAAISANCHAMKGDEDAHLFPVKWGVIDDEEGRYKCTFTTAHDVRSPVEGKHMFEEWYCNYSIIYQ